MLALTIDLPNSDEPCLRFLAQILSRRRVGVHANVAIETSCGWGSDHDVGGEGTVKAKAQSEAISILFFK